VNLSDAFHNYLGARTVEGCARLKDQLRKADAELQDLRKRLWRSALPFEVWPPLVPAPKWQRHHAAGLRTFLATDAGLALIDQANYAEQAYNRTAVKDSRAGDYMRGKAAGFSEACEMLLKVLTADVPPEEDEPEQQGEASRLRERLAS
jgi:hypothetical protein